MVTHPVAAMQPQRGVCYEGGEKHGGKTTRGVTPSRPRRPPPLHQLTLEESVTRLGLCDVTAKRMFGGLCYYAAGRPFAIVLADDLALKLPAARLSDGCGQG